jgi:hypothetical protein
VISFEKIISIKISQKNNNTKLYLDSAHNIFLEKIIHIEPLTNTINTIAWCILGVFG